MIVQCPRHVGFDILAVHDYGRDMYYFATKIWQMSNFTNQEKLQNGKAFSHDDNVNVNCG